MPSTHRGLRVMDPLDPPNVPQDMRAFVDSGPIPRFGSYDAMVAAMAPATPGMLAAVGDNVYRFSGGGKWVPFAPIYTGAWGGGNVGSSPTSTHELNRQTLGSAGTWLVQGLVAWDSGVADVSFDAYLGIGEPLWWYLNMAWWDFGHNNYMLSGIVYMGAPQTIAMWVVHHGGGACTFRGDITAALLSPA